MPAFSSPALKYDLYGIDKHYEGLDQSIRLFFDLFVQAKFYPMFSFLFGLGFFIFISRAEKKTDYVRSLFVRRIAILLLFGLFHLVFLWYGDILHTYALIGLLLLLFYNRRTKTILIWAISLLILFYLMLASPLLASPSYFIDSNSTVGSGKVKEAVDMYKGANYFDLVSYRFNNEVLPVLSYFIYEIPQILALFLLGLYVGKKRWLFEPSQHLRSVRNTWIISGIAAFPMVTWLFLIQKGYIDYGVYKDTLSSFLGNLSGIFLASFYIFSFVLLLQNEQFKKWMYPVGAAGRMALTNYMFQTIFSVTFFAITDLYNEAGLTFGLLLTFIIYGFQLVFSVQWMKHFHFGPMEWLWRSLTYKQIQPMKRGKSTNSQYVP